MSALLRLGRLGRLARPRRSYESVRMSPIVMRTGTIFERSHVPLHKWVYAMYLLVTARKGISSLQLSKEIGITQKSAWFVLHRLRKRERDAKSFKDCDKSLI